MITDEEFFQAAKNGNIVTIEGYLQNGGDINVQDRREQFLGVTALICAVKNQQVNVVRYLVDHGANPNILDSFGCSALFYAIMSSPKDINYFKEILKSFDIDVNLLQENGTTSYLGLAIHQNLFSHDALVIKELLRRGSNAYKNINLFSFVIQSRGIQLLDILYRNRDINFDKFYALEVPFFSRFYQHTLERSPSIKNPLRIFPYFFAKLEMILQLIDTNNKQNTVSAKDFLSILFVRCMYEINFIAGFRVSSFINIPPLIGIGAESIRRDLEAYRCCVYYLKRLLLKIISNANFDPYHKVELVDSENRYMVDVDLLTTESLPAFKDISHVYSYKKAMLYAVKFVDEFVIVKNTFDTLKAIFESNDASITDDLLLRQLIQFDNDFRRLSSHEVFLIIKISLQYLINNYKEMFSELYNELKKLNKLTDFNTLNIVANFVQTIRTPTFNVKSLYLKYYAKEFLANNKYDFDKIYSIDELKKYISEDLEVYSANGVDSCYSKPDTFNHILKEAQNFISEFEFIPRPNINKGI